LTSLAKTGRTSTETGVRGALHQHRAGAPQHVD